MEIFKGSCTAIITPFDNSGKIDYQTFEKLIEFQIENGTKAIVFMGTTGEASTLSMEEKIAVCKFAIKVVNHRVPVIIGAGGNNTAEVIKRSKKFEKLGADALLQVSPYYNKATQNGLIEHYTKIAKSVKIPQILYNVPSRTGVNILPETTLELSKVPNIVAIKEASGDLSQILELFRILPNDFAVYSGDDANIYSILSLGGKGVISVISNIMPKETSLLCEKYFEGKTEISKNLQLKLLPIIKKMFVEVNPIPVKFALKLMGYGDGNLRLPLTKLTEKNANELENVLKKEGLI